MKKEKLLNIVIALYLGIFIMEYIVFAILIIRGQYGKALLCNFGIILSNDLFRIILLKTLKKYNLSPSETEALLKIRDKSLAVALFERIGKQLDKRKSSEKISSSLKEEIMTKGKNDTDIIRTIRIWTPGGFIRNKNSVNIGDRLALPAFEVPSTVIGGKNEMEFKERKIEPDYAIVIDIREDEFLLVFDHCLFESAMDFNDAKDFEQTQLAKYLQGDFLNAMRKSGVPAKSCGLLSKNQLFSSERLDYFKLVRNRVTSEFDDARTRCYRLKEGVLASDNGFYWLNGFDDGEYFVRPLLKI